MNNYELTIVFSPNAGDAQAKLSEEITKIISQVKGTIGKNEEWGKRTLAYPIRKFFDGVYRYLELSVLPSDIGRVERRVKFDESVLRYLLVKADVSKPKKGKKPKASLKE